MTKGKMPENNMTEAREYEIPEDIMDFSELQGYIWGWLAKYKIYRKDFDGNEQIIKSIDYYFDWFIDRVNELEEKENGK